MSVDTQLYNVYMSSKHIKKHEIGYNIVMENNTKTTKTIEISVAEYERLKNSEEELRQRVGLLEEALRLTKRKQFGSSSEKISPETKAQLIYLFDEAETVLAIEDIITEQEAQHIHARKRRICFRTSFRIMLRLKL